MELNQTSICYYDKRLCRIAACTETADTIVPDTFPDVGRVVGAFGRPRLAASFFHAAVYPSPLKMIRL